MSIRAWALALSILASVACGPRNGSSITATSAIDAPYQLESDSDLQELRATYEAMELDDKQRTSERRRLASEYRRRAIEHLEAGDSGQAFDAFRRLLSLWHPRELKGARDLAEHQDLAQQLRSVFARSGNDVESVTALAALAVMDPAQAAAYENEIDEIFEFGDDLATSIGGPGAQRARPIEILASLTDVFPTRKMVDRLVQLYRERQKAIHSAFRRSGADIELLRLHGEGALRTSSNIVSVLARAGRIAEAARAIHDLDGIGADAGLRHKLEAALAAKDARPWIELAEIYAAQDQQQVTVLAIARETIARFPGDPAGYFVAGNAATDLDNAPLAIRLYERGLAIDRKQAKPSAALARLYEHRVSNLAFGDRPNAARKQLSEFERFYRKAQSALDAPLQPDLASAYAAMARGLVSLGELEPAQEYLERSLRIRPNLEALEYLATIALKQDRPGDALVHLRRAMTLPGDDPGARFDKLKLQRLLGEAELAEGLGKQATSTFQKTRRAWSELLEKYDLSPPYLAQGRLELGRLLWHLHDKELAIQAFFAAIDAYPAGASNYAELVSFLINEGEYDHARDIYLGALGNAEVDSYFKTYMSMWLIAEARRQGLGPDPHAQSFLDKRTGNLWHDKLARYVMRRGNLAEVERLATTRGRQAELLFYNAVLGPASENPERARELLQEVVDGNMVLFFEFDLARNRLRTK